MFGDSQNGSADVAGVDCLAVSWDGFFMKNVNKKIIGVICFFAGVVITVGSSYLYRWAKIFLDLEVAESMEKLIFLVMILPIGFGAAYCLKAFD